MSEGVTGADLKWLRRMASRRQRIATATVVAIAASLCLGVGAVNLVLASRHADEAGTTLWGIVADDHSSFRGREEYSGSHVRAIDRYVTGIIELALAIWAVAFGIAARSSSGRAERILVSLGEARSASVASG